MSFDNIFVLRTRLLNVRCVGKKCLIRSERSSSARQGPTLSKARSGLTTVARCKSLDWLCTVHRYELRTSEGLLQSGQDATEQQRGSAL